jgi:hypothetical protein
MDLLLNVILERLSPSLPNLSNGDIKGGTILTSALEVLNLDMGDAVRSHIGNKVLEPKRL